MDLKNKNTITASNLISMRTKITLLFISILICVNSYAQNWSALSTGMDNVVYSIASDPATGTIYAGGNFTIAGGSPINYIAKWDGATWTSVGGGTNASINALYFENGILYAGGNFTTAGATPANFIAKWDGTAWSALGSGLDNGVLVIIGDGTGNIYAGGGFTTAGGNAAERIAKWNGTSWSAMGSGLGIAGDYVETIESYNGNIYAGGRFQLAGVTTVNSIARWDGTNWNALTTGVTGLSGRVIGIKTYNGELYVCGSFTDAGGVAVTSLAKWNGTAWSALAAGGLTGGQSKPTSIEVLYGELYVAGNFTTAGAVSALNIARYDGTTWNALGVGVNAQVDFLFPSGNKMYVGGQFATADTLTVNFIAAYQPACNTTVNATIANTNCFGFCDGSISLAPTGAAPFSYQWSGGLTGNPVTNLCPGTYTATITNQFGCTITENYTVTEPAQLTVSFTTTDAICNAQCSGTAVAIANNAQGNVAYLWNTTPQQTTATATALCAGTVVLQIVDSAGCNAIDSVVINEPVANAATIGFSIPSCFGGCNGYAVATSTGTAPFSYSWTTTPVQTTDTAFNLCSGTYSVTIVDSLGCSASETILMIDPVPNVATATSTPTICYQQCSGTATASSTGLPPFTYSWQTFPMQDSVTAVGLCPGFAIVVVTDSLGCTASDTVLVTEPIANVISSTGSPAQCAAACNGEVTLSSTGTSPFQYAWSTGDTTVTVSTLCEGGYAVTVTDALGCAVSDSVFVGLAAPIPVVFTTVPATCAGDCIGTASAQLQTSLASTFVWSNGDSIQSIDSLCAGYYTVTIVDTAGCTYSDSVNIGLGLPFNLNAAIAAPTCFGLCNASVSLSPAGVAPFTYLWINGDTTNALANICAGVYPVTVTDSSNCITNDTITIVDPADISYTKSHTDALCPGQCSGTATLNNAIGNGPVTYLWNTIPPQSTNVGTGLCFGYTSFTVTDSVGCVKLDSVLIFEPPSINVFQTVTDISCFGDCDASVVLNVSGGTPNYSYLWSNGSGLPGLLNICAGTYTVTVTDFNGCAKVDSTVITGPSQITFTPTIVNTSCFSCNDGSISVTVNGGTPPYDYLFTQLAITDTVANNLTAGIYQFCVLDDNNCFICDSFVVTSPIPVFNSNPLENKIVIYPNPTKGLFYVKAQNETAELLNVVMTDLAGRKVQVQSSYVSNKVIAVDAVNLRKGIYMISVYNKTELISTGRIVID